MMKKFLFILTLLLLLPGFRDIVEDHQLDAQSTASYGVVVTSLTTSSAGAVTGTVFAVPSSYAAIITWQVVSDSGTLVVNLEGSLDNISWNTIDTTTASSVRNFGFSAVKFVRCSQASRTGGTSTNCTIVVNRGFINGGNFSLNRVLTGDGTAASPAWSFLSEPTLGMFRIANNTLGFAIGNTSRMFLDGVQLGLHSSNVLAWGSSGTSGIDTTIGRSAAGKVVLNGGTNNTLMFGGTTASFPSIKQVGTALQVIASDSSAFADLSVNSLTAAASSTFNGGVNNTAAGGYAWTGRGMLTAPADGNVVINNAALTIGSRIKADALPTIGSGFGTSPSVTVGSTAFAGSVNVGTGGTATTGIITFNGTAFPSTPFCIYSNTTSNSVTRGTPTTTQLTLNTTTAWTASDIVTWQCVSAK